MLGHRLLGKSGKPSTITESHKPDENRSGCCCCCPTWSRTERLLLIIAINTCIFWILMTVVLIILNMRSQTLETTLVQSQGIMTAFTQSGALEALAATSLKLTTVYLPDTDLLLASAVDVVTAFNSGNSTQTIEKAMIVARNAVNLFALMFSGNSPSTTQ